MQNHLMSHWLITRGQSLHTFDSSLITIHDYSLITASEDSASEKAVLELL